MFVQYTVDDVSKVPASGIDPAGPPFECLLCARMYPHKAKLIFHYVVNHRLRFCVECCTVLREPHRMTHENSMHWPYECQSRKCRAEFFSPFQLGQHYERDHSLKSCDFCKVVVGADAYKEHLRVQHDVSAVDLDGIRAGRVVRITDEPPDATKRITKFHCLLCSQEKQFSSFQGHFLTNHKLSLPKFLEMTERMLESYAHLLDRIGQLETVKNELNENLKSSAKADMAGTIASHFEMRRKEQLDDGDNAEESLLDFDSSLVQCVTSTDEEDESEQESGGGDQLSYSCPYCEGSAVGHGGMGRHLRDVHGFQVRNFESRCHLCRKEFVNQLGLLRHNRKAHPSISREVVDRTQKCPFCVDTKIGREQMRMHIREHIDRNSFPCNSDRLGFCCRFCPERFWTVSQKNAHQMLRHARDMTNDDLMMCRQCGVTMSSKTCLRDHTADAHPSFTQIGKLVFKCSLCLIVHSSLADCRAHMLMTHPRDIVSYCCRSDCRAKLADGQTLDGHLRTQHPTLFEFKCLLCDSVMASQQGCMKHMRSKHANRNAVVVKEES